MTTLACVCRGTGQGVSPACNINNGHVGHDQFTRGLGETKEPHVLLDNLWMIHSL